MDLISVDIKAQMEGSRKCTELEWRMQFQMLLGKAGSKEG